MDDDALSSYFHHHHPTNHIFSNPNPNLNPSHSSPPPPPAAAVAADGPSSLIFPRAHSGWVPVAQPEPVLKRKRGRPRKYGALSPSPPPSSSSSFSLPSPSSSSLHPHSTSSPRKKASSSSNKAHLAALGSAGQGFTPHFISVAAGEDVTENIMSFVQQQKRAVCILSASGSISSASIHQPAMPGSNITYEGRFEILTLSGSFLHTETGGAAVKTGGLTVCLSGADGRIVGGGVGGPLLAAGPVQVIVCSFLIDMEKIASTSVNTDKTASKMSAHVAPGATFSPPVSLRSCQESSSRMATYEGSNDHQNFGVSGGNYMFHSQDMPVMPSKFPTDWRGRQDSGYVRPYMSPDDEDEGDFRD